jgi:hypothetical protein
VTLTLPVDDGTSGQVLSTDGNGALSWAGATFATGAMASYGYHTNDCNGTDEKFIQYATVSGVAYGLCIEKNERSTVVWGDAAAICLALGKRLPDYNEWRKACDGKTSGSAGTTDSFFSNMTGNWEWASSRPAAVTNTLVGSGALIAGGSSCDSVYWYWVRAYNGGENSATFRCVR